MVGLIAITPLQFSYFLPTYNAIISQLLHANSWHLEIEPDITALSLLLALCFVCLVVSSRLNRLIRILTDVNSECPSGQSAEPGYS